jgi:hypothetical protein
MRLHSLTQEARTKHCKPQFPLRRKRWKKIKKHKKYQATKDLLDDWETQTDAYAKALATESNNRMQIEVQRIAAANQLKAQQEAANLAAANKVCDKAFEITENYQSTVNGLKKLLKTQVESVQTLAAEVKKNGAKLTLSEGKARLQKLNIAAGEVASLAMKATAAMESLRSDLVFFAGQALRASPKTMTSKARRRRDWESALPNTRRSWTRSSWTARRSRCLGTRSTSTR